MLSDAFRWTGSDSSWIVRRIVCDMAEALLPHSPGGPVELCIGVCSAEYRTLSTQTYSFVVSV